MMVDLTYVVDSEEGDQAARCMRSVRGPAREHFRHASGAERLLRLGGRRLSDPRMAPGRARKRLQPPSSTAAPASSWAKGAAKLNATGHRTGGRWTRQERPTRSTRHANASTAPQRKRRQGRRSAALRASRSGRRVGVARLDPSHRATGHRSAGRRPSPAAASDTGRAGRGAAPDCCAGCAGLRRSATGRAGHAGTTDARSSGGGQVGEKPWAVLRVAEDHLPLHTVRPCRSARAAVQHELLRGSGAEFAKPVCFSDEAAVRIEEECSAVVVGSGVQLGQVSKARCGIRLPGTAIVAEPGIGPGSRLHQVALARRIQVLLLMEEER